MTTERLTLAADGALRIDLASGQSIIVHGDGTLDRVVDGAVEPDINGQLEHALDAGIDAAQAVVDNWERGDLAGAVNVLEDWATNAADLLPDSGDK